MDKWINAEEQMPPEGVLVLCAGPRGGMFLGDVVFKNSYNGKICMHVPNSRGWRDAKYWMPLPEPPKEE